MAKSTPHTAVFDLDVTLTRYDSYMPFLRGYLHRHRRRWPRVAMLPIRLLAVWRWGSRDWVKEQFLRAFLGGEPRARVAAWAREFSAALHADAMRLPGLACLREHQERGDRVILASASFDIYVEEVARHLGIEEVIATRIDWNDADRLAGMQGRNCRDDEKLRRVRALLDGSDGGGVIAYSDSHADLPLLKWAEQGVAVAPSRRLSEQVTSLGLTLADW